MTFAKNLLARSVGRSTARPTAFDLAAQAQAVSTPTSAAQPASASTVTGTTQLSSKVAKARRALASAVDRARPGSARVHPAGSYPLPLTKGDEPSAHGAAMLLRAKGFGGIDANAILVAPHGVTYDVAAYTRTRSALIAGGLFNSLAPSATAPREKKPKTTTKPTAMATTFPRQMLYASSVSRESELEVLQADDEMSD